MSEEAFLAAGAALYAGEGSKGDGKVQFSNCDPRMTRFFCAWFRTFFEVDERRLRLRIYLHQGLDVEAAIAHWCEVTAIPRAQVGVPYRAVPNPSIRKNKHPMGCAYVCYTSSRTRRAVMGLVHALLSSPFAFRGSSVGEHATVNRVVVGSSPTPGAQQIRGGTARRRWRRTSREPRPAWRRREPCGGSRPARRRCLPNAGSRCRT